MADRTLDVRAEPRMNHHNIVFSNFDELKEGAAFVLVSEHDPRPLHSQFDFVRNGKFSWDQLESGPEVWRVRIGRTRD